MLTPELAAQHQTPEEHVDFVKALTEQLSGQSPIQSCFMDDYGRFSNFSVVVNVDPNVFQSTRKDVLTRKINALFDQALSKTQAHRRATFAPEARRGWCKTHQKKCTHYDRISWSVDIDFQHFDPQSNSFSRT